MREREKYEPVWETNLTKQHFDTYRYMVLTKDNDLPFVYILRYRGEATRAVLNAERSRFWSGLGCDLSGFYVLMVVVFYGDEIGILLGGKEVLGD